MENRMPVSDEELTVLGKFPRPCSFINKVRFICVSFKINGRSNHRSQSILKRGANRGKVLTSILEHLLSTGFFSRKNGDLKRSNNHRLKKNLAGCTSRLLKRQPGIGIFGLQAP